MQHNNLLADAAAALEYIRRPQFAPSFSSLSALLPCNLGLYKYICNKIAKEKGQDEQPTDAMVMGSCVDRYIFEYLFPMQHNKELRFLPYVSIDFDGSLATKEGKAAKEKALHVLARKTDEAKDLGLTAPYLLKPAQIADIEQQVELLQYQYPPHLQASLYDLLINYATDVQKQISIPLPLTFYGNCPKAKGVIDAYGYNPETGRYYLLDLKRMPEVTTKRLYNTINDRNLAMQIALYKKGLENLGKRVDDCYILALDGVGNSNIYKFSPIELSNAWRNIDKTVRRLDELIENGTPADMLKSFCEPHNCAIY